MRHAEQGTITIQGYCDFLEAAITSNDFYDQKMAADLGPSSILRVGEPGNYRYEVIDRAAAATQQSKLEVEVKQTAVSEESDSPMHFLSEQDVECYCAWKNSTSTSTFNFNCCAVGAASAQIDRELKSNLLTFRLSDTGAESHQAGGPAIIAAAGIDEILKDIFAGVFLAVGLQGGGRATDHIADVNRVDHLVESSERRDSLQDRLVSERDPSINLKQEIRPDRSRSGRLLGGGPKSDPAKKLSKEKSEEENVPLSVEDARILEEQFKNALKAHPDAPRLIIKEGVIVPPNSNSDSNDRENQEIMRLLKNVITVRYSSEIASGIHELSPLAFVSAKALSAAKIKEILERINSASRVSGADTLDRVTDDFPSSSFSPYATEEPMMIGIKSASSIPLDTIRRVIDSDPKAARLIVGGNKNNPSLVAHSPWYGSALRVVFGDSADRQARQTVRESIKQEYGQEVADRACPPTHDGETLSAFQADRILKMAPVIQEKRNEYPLSHIRDEKMSLVTYARDTALVAQDAITKLLQVKKGLWKTFKQESMNDIKSIKALRSHPDFIAAREDAIQATLHASEAAAATVTALQKTVTTDFSFGAHAALAAAQFHATIAKLSIVSTGEEKHLDYKADEALQSATDAYDSYKAYKNAPAIASSLSSTTSSVEEAAIIRKQQLQHMIRKTEAVKEYGAKILKSVDDLCGIMATFAPFETVPIQQFSARLQWMVDGITTKAQQIPSQLADEENNLLIKTDEFFRQRDKFCRDAATQRTLANTRRAIATLEDAIENIGKIIESNAQTFLSLYPKMRSCLEPINQAQQEYQARRASLNPAANKGSK